jgi:hypothetical protein
VANSKRRKTTGRRSGVKMQQGRKTGARKRTMRRSYSNSSNASLPFLWS